MEHHYCPSCGFPVGNLGQTTDDKFIGKSLPGGYYILDLISVGGMGRIYRAEQSTLGRTVAVKFIHPHLLSDENSALRFITEARAASQLNHPNSIAVYDFGRTEDKQPYMVMEFLRGRDLARVAYEEGPLPFAMIADVLRQVLAALAEAHELGIIHRDLKPENVILKPLRRGGNFVKVVDFGLAKLRADTRSPGVTSPGIVCGTPDYMAPEQGRGETIDGRSDLYAVGVMLFQLLTGRLPFEAESPTQVVMMHLTVPVPDPRHVAPERNIPESLVEVVRKALAKDANFRFQDATEFSDALKTALETAQTAPPPDRRTSLIPPPVLSSGATVVCPACENYVPSAKFCFECGVRLPLMSGHPEPPSVVKFPLPFLSREDELTWLDDRRQRALTGVQAVRIIGEAGAGKTRLMQEFLNHARSEGDIATYVGPDSFYAEVAYSTLREIIADLAQLGTEPLRERVVVSSPRLVFAGLTEIFSGSATRGDERAPEERRFGLAEALRWALALAAERAATRRVVLAIDDLYRVDGTSRNAIADVIASPPNLPLVVVGAHVPGFDPVWGKDVLARILPGLPPPVVMRFLRRNTPTAFVDEVKGVAPMYVEQVIRYSQEGGTDPPGRLADLIGLRVDTLPSDARRTLQALAVMGDRVSRDTVESLLPRTDNLEATLIVLERAGMIIRSAGVISCSHPLLREIALSGIPAAARRDLHQKALRACEKVQAPLEAAAQHAFQAGDTFQALLLLERIADQAASRGDLTTEILALRRGLEMARLEIARGELDDPLRAVLIFARKLGASLTRAGDYADAEGVLREALDFAGPNGTDRAKLLSALAHVAHGRRRSVEALAYLEQAIDAAQAAAAPELVSIYMDTRRIWAS